MDSGDEVVRFDVWGQTPPPFAFWGDGSRNGRECKAGIKNTRGHDWNDLVWRAGRDAMKARGHREPYDGLVEIFMVLYAETPNGKRDGDPWDGPGCPDTTNVFKAGEDALRRSVLKDDCQVKRIHSEMLYGPVPGVRVIVRKLKSEGSILRQWGQ